MPETSFCDVADSWKSRVIMAILFAVAGILVVVGIVDGIASVPMWEWTVIVVLAVAGVAMALAAAACGS